MIGAIMFFLIWFPLNIARRIWWNWKIEGVENLPPRPQGCVLAVNHLNWTDIHTVGSSVPLSHRPWWMAKIELFNGRFATWWLRQMQVIPIRRGKRDLSALYESEQVIKDGAVFIVFPEGHRSDTGALQEGKNGALRLAIRSGVPIVPVAIFGTEVGLKKIMLRSPITVRFGKPYIPQADPDHIPATQMARLTDEMMIRIAELMPERYWGFYASKMLPEPATTQPTATEAL